MTEISVTEAEIMDALAAAGLGSAPKDARTVREIAEGTGLSASSVQRLLQTLVRSGRVTVYRVERTRIDGQRGLVPAYAVVRASATAKNGRKSPRNRRGRASK